MNEDYYKIQMDYSSGKIKPSERIKKILIYSEQRLGFDECFDFDGYQLKLTPLLNGGKLSDNIKNGYLAAFICEVKFDDTVADHIDELELLSVVLTWLEFDYIVGKTISEKIKYKDEWVDLIVSHAEGHSLMTYNELPKKDVHKTVKSYKKIQKLGTKQSKKVVNIKNFLQEGLRLKRVSILHSFLSFYKVIEMVSDHCSSKGIMEVNNDMIKDMVTYKLVERPSQKIKIFFLLKAFKNNYNIEAAINLARLRNDLSHSTKQISVEDLKLCQEIAFWAGEILLYNFEGCNER